MYDFPITRRLVVLAAVVWTFWLPGSSHQAFSQPAAPAAGEGAPGHGGEIRGLVVSAANGQPIAGAYVGVGDFGDAGGANLERFEKQGLYAHTETDEQGRFRLAGVAVAEHPLVVMHPDFVCHGGRVALRPDATAADVKISLTPAAKIRAVVVDEADVPVKRPLTIRLESLAGHRIIPPGRNPHLSSFASATWSQPAKAGSYLFTGLPEGDYAFDALAVGFGHAEYHGGIERIRMKAGETREILIKPQAHHNVLRMSVSNADRVEPQFPSLVVVNRNVGLLVWDDGLIHHPEDQRLGRIVLGALMLPQLKGGSPCEIRNLPPGVYSLFAGPVLALKGMKVEVIDGRDQELKIEWTRPTKGAVVPLGTLDRRVQPAKGAYPAGELCALLTEKTESRPEFKVALAQANEVVHLGPGSMSIWEIVERMHVEKGWTATEDGEGTLVVGPASEVEKNARERSEK